MDGISSQTTIGQLLVKLGLDTAAFKQGMSDAEGQAKQSASVIQSAFSVLTGVLGAEAIKSGFEALKEGFSSTIELAKESQEIDAQTAAAIQSTGDASGQSAEQIKDYATALSQQIPVSRDTIQQTENMLLTFTNLKGQTFPAATQAVLDMSAAFKAAGKDMNLSDIAIQVGKALNDPINGMTALKRVGVELDAEQQQQIKNFMAVGDAADAQKVILDELGREFGGSALAQGQTLAGQQEIMAEKFHQTEEEVGTALLPVLDTLASSALPGVNAALAVVPGIINAVAPAIEFLGNLFGQVAQIAAGFLATIFGAPAAASAAASSFGDMTANATQAGTAVSQAGAQGAANLANLQDQSDQADAAIKQIDSSTQSLNTQQHDLQRKISDTGAAYDAQSQQAQQAQQGVQAQIDATSARFDAQANAIKGSEEATQRQIDNVTAAFDAQANAVKANEESVQNQIDATTQKFDDQLSALKDQQDRLTQQAEQITDSYTAQIDPLQKQLDLLKQSVTVEQQKADLENQLQDTQLQEAQLAAEGDPVKRAQLASQIALLKSKEDQLNLDKEIQQTQSDLANAPLKAQQAQLDAQKQQLQFQQQQQAIDAAAAKQANSDAQQALKLKQQGLDIDKLSDQIQTNHAAGKDTHLAEQQLALKQQQYQLDLQNAAGGDSNSLATKQAILSLDEQRYALSQQMAANSGNTDDSAALGVKLQELQAQKQLNDLSDPQKLADIAGQQQLLKDQEQKNKLVEDEQKTKNDILSLPLQQQVDQLKQAEQDKLDPINAQLKTLKDQTDELNKQKDQALKPLQAQLKDLQSQEKQINDARTAALAPLQAQLKSEQQAEQDLSQARTAALAPLQAQQKTLQQGEQGINAAKQAALAPMQKQLQNLQDQNQQLADQKQHWQDIKNQAQQAMTDAQNQPVASFASAGPAKGPGEGALAGTGVVTQVAATPQIPQLSPNAKAALDGLKDTLSWFEQHQAVTEVLAGIAAAFALWGPVAGLVSGVAGAIATFASIVSTVVANVGAFLAVAEPLAEPIATLGLLIDPVTAILLGVAGAVALLTVAWLNDWGGIREKTEEVIGAVKPVLESVMTTLSRFWTETEPKLSLAWQNIQHNADVVFHFLDSLIRPVVTGIVDFLSDHARQIEAVFGGVWDILKGIVETDWAIISGIIQVGLDLLDGNWSAAWQDFLGIFSGVWNGLGDIVSGAWAVVKNEVSLGVDALLALVGEISPKTAALGRAVVDGIWSGISGAADWLKTQVEHFLTETLPDVVKKVLGIASPSTVMRDLAAEIPAGLWQGIQNYSQLPAELTDWLGHNLLDLFADADRWLLQAGSDVIAGLWSGVQSATDFAGNVQSWLGTNLLALFANAKTWLLQAGADVVAGLWSGISGVGDFLGNVQSWATSHVSDAIRDALGLGKSGANLLARIGGDAVAAIWSGLSTDLTLANNLGSWASSTIVDGIRTALGLIGGGANLMEGVGKSIIQGIWQGISSMGDWFKQVFNDWIKSHLPGPLADALQIKSPSRVFAELGKQIPAGLLQGIDAGGADLARRMQSLVPTPALPTATRLPLNPIPATSGLHGIDPQQVGDLHIHNEVFGQVFETLVVDVVRREIARST